MILGRLPAPHRLRRLTATGVVLLATLSPARAGEMREGGKLLLTTGITSVEGSAGGGLASWALIAGDETRDGVGASAHVTFVPLADFGLTSYGAALGVFDRLELSYAHERFDTRAAGAALGLGHGYAFSEDVFGAKLRLAGDAVYDADRAMPQIAIGMQAKRANRDTVIHAIGGAHANGVDFYASTTKVLLGQGLVLDATVRLTKANQFGLLGFGGDAHRGYSAQVEGSAGYLVTRRVLVGGEVRTKPDNLGFAREDDSYDLFIAYAPSHHLALTAAYVDLGSIATFSGQRGAFLSLQTSF